MCLHAMSAPKLLIVATLTLLAAAQAAVCSARKECDGGDGVRRTGRLHHAVVQDAADQDIAAALEAGDADSLRYVMSNISWLASEPTKGAASVWLKQRRWRPEHLLEPVHVAQSSLTRGVAELFRGQAVLWPRAVQAQFHRTACTLHAHCTRCMHAVHVLRCMHAAHVLQHPRTLSGWLVSATHRSAGAAAAVFCSLAASGGNAEPPVCGGSPARPPVHYGTKASAVP